MRVAGSPAEALRLVTPVDGGPVQRCISILDAQDACIGITRVVLGFGNSGLGIFGVWVEPAFRSRGLARWMCAAAVGLAAEFGAPRTWLQVEKGNAKAQRLYRALGYADCYAYECWVHPGPLDGEAVK
jgi:ribosomal protein S18 acetylase RimI-like enzyme